MAQTISIQRGSVTYTARGDNSTSNITTLFTNTSSGNGTRVIVNYLTVQNPYVTGGGIDQTGARCAGLLGVVSAGTTGTIIGGMTNNASYTNVFAMPIGDPGIASVGGASTLFASPRFLNLFDLIPSYQHFKVWRSTLHFMFFFYMTDLHLCF